jgi:hypothetical protein
MMLTTHALAGAAAAALIPAHPVAGFAAGFASHFVLDAIPHWNFKPSSIRNPDDLDRIDMPFSRQFWKDVVVIGADGLLGLVLALTFFAHDAVTTAAVLAGAAGGILPDALQFVYFKFKKEPLVSLQKFHKGIQNTDKTRFLQARPVLGMVLQVLLLAAVVAAHPALY